MTLSQFNPEKLVFFVGIPGSGWAKIDSMLRCCRKFNFNISDYSDSRSFKRISKYEAHMTPLEVEDKYKGTIVNGTFNVPKEETTLSDTTIFSLNIV